MERSVDEELVLGAMLFEWGRHRRSWTGLIGLDELYLSQNGSLLNV